MAETINPNCLDCSTVCALRSLAEQVTANLPTAGAEALVREVAVDDTRASVESAELRLLEAKTVNDMVGLHVEDTDGSEEDLANARQAKIAALGGVIENNDQTHMLRGFGPYWAGRARALANECVEVCDGPRRGLRLPLLQLVVPLPWGKKHCGSPLRKYAESHMRMADSGIREGVEAVHPDQRQP